MFAVGCCCLMMFAVGCCWSWLIAVVRGCSMLCVVVRNFCSSRDQHCFDCSIMMLLQARKSQLAYARTWGLRWWDAAATLVETERYCSITAMSIDLRNHNGIREGCCGRWTQGAATGSASPHWWQYQEKDLAVAGPMEAGSCCACSGGAIMQLGWMALSRGKVCHCLDSPCRETGSTVGS